MKLPPSISLPWSASLPAHLTQSLIIYKFVKCEMSLFIEMSLYQCNKIMFIGLEALRMSKENVKSENKLWRKNCSLWN